VEGNAEGIMRLGATGGYMGHVMLVTAPPRCLVRASAEGQLLQNIWPAENPDVLWAVNTMESCRAHAGYHETEYLMFLDQAGRILLQGEYQHGDDGPKLLKYEEDTPVLLFQSPSELRDNFRQHLFQEALESMRKSQASWSWATAVKAFLLSAEMQTQHLDSRRASLEGVKQCWNANPICTSVVIECWQQYLCGLADECNANRLPNEPASHALDWICQWMPLKADRALPGDLISTLQQCNWVPVSIAQQQDEIIRSTSAQAILANHRRPRFNTM
jgi:hypothetical protein